jgi:hypothetical protein
MAPTDHTRPPTNTDGSPAAQPVPLNMDLLMKRLQRERCTTTPGAHGKRCHNGVRGWKRAGKERRSRLRAGFAQPIAPNTDTSSAQEAAA